MLLNRLSNVVQFFNGVRRFFNFQFISRQFFAKIMSFGLICSILTVSTPAAPQVIISTSQQIGQNIRYAYLTSPTVAYLSQISLFDNSVIGFFFKTTKRQQTISRIEVSPKQAVIREGEQLVLTATALDGRGNPVQGVGFKWTARSSNQKAAPISMREGVFSPQYAGLFEITAETGGMTGKVQIRVLKDARMVASKEATEILKNGETRKAQRNLRAEVVKELNGIKPTAFSYSSRMTMAATSALVQQEKDYLKTSPLKKVLDPNLKTPQIPKAKQPAKNQTAPTEEVEEIANENKKGGPNAESSAPETKAANLTGDIYGYLDYVSGSPVTGCAYETGNYGLNVEFFIDGDPYSGIYAGSSFAGMSCDFSFIIPNSFWDGQQHSIGAFAWSSTFNTYVELNNSPQTFQLGGGGGGGGGSGTNSGWNNNNSPTYGNPGVQPGNPANTGTDGAGSGNFSFSAPVLSLSGRGMDVNLSLNYNSLLWHKAGTEMSYDIEKGSPAPGWDIGFGKMMDMGSVTGASIEGIDGTRHPYEVETQNWYGGYSTHFGRTIDGSFIDYQAYRSPSGLYSGIAYLANGTKVTYGAAANGVLYPTQIKDRHGNYITIAYQNNQGPHITTITDNLNRNITFNYDGGNRLVSITGPGFNGSTQTFVRLHYTQQTLSFNYPGMTTQVRDNNPYQIDAIYYPATNTGYWFADPDSYSSYGMIKKVKEVRNMTCNCPSNTDQGSMTAELMTRQQVYDYQTAGALTEAPKYTKMTEDWFGREASTPVSETLYGISTNPAAPAPRTTTITLPNGNSIKQYSVNNPGFWDDGLLTKIETLAPGNGNVILSKSETAWAQGDYNSVRVTQIQSTDEKQQTTTQTFTYNTSGYNQVESVSEFGYSNNFLRKKVNTYENGVDYRGYYTTINGKTIFSNGRHIFSLPKTEEIYADQAQTAPNRLSRNEYYYDQSPLMDAPGVPMYDQTYNPHTTEMIQGPNCVNWEQQWNSWEYEDVCIEYEQIQNFDASTQARGNVTATKTFSDAPNLGGAIVYDSTYDIVGNTRTTTTDCCQQMAFGYSMNTKYSQPDWHRKGSISDPATQMTESATYDPNTGLVLSSFDFNNLQTQYVYDAANRPVQVISPTQAKSVTDYDDVNLKVTQTALKFNSPGNYDSISQSKSFANGRGQVYKTESILGASTTVSEVEYDSLGRKARTSMPHDISVNASLWTTYHYDVLSRVIKVVAPDLSESKTFYNEATRPSSASSASNPQGQPIGSTVRSQDAWGRERWARTDDFGRLVEVVEPDPNGNGSVLTSGNMVTNYQYDPLDQLTLVTQGTQQRAFKYDSLGRLTRQKLAEQAATIEGLWSDAFIYDNRSNLVQRTDARGVKTNFVYNNDPLNRLQSINYDKTQAANPTTIADAGAVTIGYETGGDKSRVSTVTTAATANTPVVTEINGYDSYSRVGQYAMTIGTKPVMQMNYVYDTANRLTKVFYPNQYGTSNPSFRKEVNPTYDNASRLQSLDVNGAIQLSGIVYNPMSQVTELITGAFTNNADVERYSYDNQTGLLTNQKVYKANNMNDPILNLSYDYQRGNSNGSLNGKTGQLTKITNHLNSNKNRKYEFDTLGRLRLARGGYQNGEGYNPAVIHANWSQTYGYDRYGNRTNVTAGGNVVNPNTGDPEGVPLDGLGAMSYDQYSNRITNANYIYDEAGNLIKGQAADGSWQYFQYDAAGRLVVIKQNDVNGAVLETYAYGASRQRLITETPSQSQRKYYAWGGSSVLCEYTEALNGTGFAFSKSYIYAGSRLLSTQVWNGNSETTEFHHPDRLGTKLVTNNAANTHYEQSTLPFGTSLDAEFIGTPTTNQRFTSYDRSQTAQLDYAVNRSYSSGQGRFTSVDPIGMSSASIGNPQSLNLFSYTQNNPVDFTDPSGLLRIQECTRQWWVDSNGQIHYSSWQCTTIYDDGGGGGGGAGGGAGGNNSSGNSNSSNAKPTDKQIKDAVNFCMNKIWNTAKKSFTLNLTNMDFAVSGVSNGSATVQQTFRSDGRSRTFNVKTDALSSSGAELSSTNKGLGGRDGGGYLMGLTLSPANQGSNSIANDLSQNKTHSLETGLDKLIGKSKATQIHELGVSLSFVKGIGQLEPLPGFSDPDTGMHLEKCVSDQLKGK